MLFSDSVSSLPDILHLIYMKKSLCLLDFQWIEAHTFPSRMSKFIDFGASKSIRDNSVNLSCFLKMKLKRQEACQKLNTYMFDMGNILLSLLIVHFIQVWFFSIKKFGGRKQKYTMSVITVSTLIYCFPESFSVHIKK